MVWFNGNFRGRHSCFWSFNLPDSSAGLQILPLSTNAATVLPSGHVGNLRGGIKGPLINLIKQKRTPRNASNGFIIFERWFPSHLKMRFISLLSNRQIKINNTRVTFFLMLHLNNNTFNSASWVCFNTAKPLLNAPLTQLFNEIQTTCQFRGGVGL